MDGSSSTVLDRMSFSIAVVVGRGVEDFAGEAARAVAGPDAHAAAEAAVGVVLE